MIFIVRIPVKVLRVCRVLTPKVTCVLPHRVDTPVCRVLRLRARGNRDMRAHFPLKVSLPQSEKNGVRKIWNLRYKLPKTRNSKSKKNANLPVSEAHCA
jgi:hypothetical protein